MAGVLLALGSAGAAEAPGSYQIEPLSKEGSQSYDLKTGLMKATGGVRVRYETVQGKDVELTADRVQLNQATGEALAEGTVFLRGEGHLWRGEKLEEAVTRAGRCERQEETEHVHV
ncbi:MAG: hypothetical protein EBY09_11090, partial [Verrucomicrobia bacterium]|nr:hypothetical protein [Verrucomicrobiota bacterium]